MAARSTMTTLVQRVRELTATGTADYTVGTASYWSDEQLQAVLDRNRLEFVDNKLAPLKETDSGGTVRYYVHQVSYINLEETTGGTAILYVRDSDGTRAGTADYTVDYLAGRVTFTADTAGTAYYLTGRTYDLYAAAAEVWRQKAAHVAERFDFSADGASFKASQLRAQYMEQAEYCASWATFGAPGIRTTTMWRDDVNLFK
jgi:hypothetical protein